jgi:hypothetical protein
LTSCGCVGVTVRVSAAAGCAAQHTHNAPRNACLWACTVLVVQGHMNAWHACMANVCVHADVRVLASVAGLARGKPQRPGGACKSERPPQHHSDAACQTRSGILQCVLAVSVVCVVARTRAHTVVQGRDMRAAARAHLLLLALIVAVVVLVVALAILFARAAVRCAVWLCPCHACAGVRVHVRAFCHSVYATLTAAPLPANCCTIHATSLPLRPSLSGVAASTTSPAWTSRSSCLIARRAARATASNQAAAAGGPSR